MQFTLKLVFATVTFVAISLVLLINASKWTENLAYSATGIVLLAAVCCAVGGVDRWRRRAVAFLGGAWTFLVFYHLVCGTEEYVQRLPTTWLADLVWRAFRFENPDGLVDDYGTPYYLPEWYYVADIAHLLTSIALGIAVALVADVMHTLATKKDAT